MSSAGPGVAGGETPGPTTSGLAGDSTPDGSGQATATPAPSPDAGSGTPVNTGQATASPAPSPAAGSGTPASGGGAMMSLDAPASASGPFTVTVNISGAPAYRAFQIELSYDTGLVKVSSIDYAGVLGPQDQVFCLKPTTGTGQADIGCTVLGSGSTTASGAAAVFHLEPLHSGTVNLHLRTVGEVGKSLGTKLLDPDAQSITVATQDASVAVTAG